MGTWGTGNLDNDHAEEELFTRGQGLLHSFLQRARCSTSREPDEYDYTTLFVELELLLALDQRGLLRGPLVDPAEIQALASDYLAEWDAMIDDFGSSEAHKAGRRVAIEQSFEQLRQICERVSAEQHAPFVEQQLVFLAGPPGMGKSTVLRRLAPSLGSVAWAATSRPGARGLYRACRYV